MKKISTLLTLSALIFVGGSAMAKDTFKIPERNVPTPDFSQNVGTRVDIGITDVIFNPAGKKVAYKKNITGLEWGSPYDEESGTTIIFGENNEVYFCDIVGRELSIVYGSYVKGEIVGDEIRVPVPQTVKSYGTWGQDVTLREKGEDGEYYYSEYPYITYSYDKETGVIKTDLPGEEGQYIIGLTWSYDGSWNETGDFTQVYTPLGMNYNTLPEDISLDTYYLNDNYYGYPVEIGTIDNKMYIKGLSLEDTDIVIEGDIEGDIVKIPQNQLLASMFGDFVWTKILLFDDIQELVLAPEDMTYDLRIDKENKSLSSVVPDIVFALNGKTDRVFYLETFVNFTLKMQDSFAGTPINPYWLSFDGEDFREAYGIYGFNFTMTNISTEGNVLNINGLYYSIYVDGDILEFEETEGLYNTMYPGIEGVMTQIPFEFSNGYDIDYTSLTGRFIGIYPDGVSTVGVQSIYHYEGVETKSDIVTMDVETGEITTESGIESVVIDMNDVRDIEYYSLDGSRVKNPDKGLYIKKYNLANGKSVTRKVMVK